MCCALACGAARAQNDLSSSFPTAKPATPALSDPIGRQLNIALGLAGGLRKEASEGRAGGERAGELLEQLQKTLLGVRESAPAQDRKAGDEAWSRPQSEALALIDEARQLRLEAMRMPPSNAQLRVLRDLGGKLGRIYDKVSEASRKRNQTVANSARNVK